MFVLELEHMLRPTGTAIPENGIVLLPDALRNIWKNGGFYTLLVTGVLGGIGYAILERYFKRGRK